MNQKQLRCTLAVCIIIVTIFFIHGSVKKNQHDASIAEDTHRIADALNDQKKDARLQSQAHFFLKNTKDIDPCGAGSTPDICLPSQADFYLDNTKIKSDAESPRK